MNPNDTYRTANEYATIAGLIALGSVALVVLLTAMDVIVRLL